ncbi:MAC/perforin domain protein, putative (macronuclear) [Tetrahymena thermophila SB210]|uniref:MAC/perforin domain protein, putative n=1 Tax=Tetrahymena thermophila (strain SB210) TaxID=312017 RepID=Q23JN9_TETTS|nr:MAC/perforin domain protein, putative [Tetrahymena thermophila SB210]EAR96704.2 MAC/perforin domain protein, putative [Tetrahymena thermophila SB210]|eukprot:XP_001016949.2 MAC/perforin domain protein, putative [Tetrahymena thermophila SB210]
MKATGICPVRTDRIYAEINCLSGLVYSPYDLFKEVGYERNQEGNNRSVCITYLLMQKEVLKNLLMYFVDRGYSIAQYYEDNKYFDFNLPPPNKTMFKLVCTDFMPSIYKSPQGYIFQCSCPVFEKSSIVQIYNLIRIIQIKINLFLIIKNIKFLYSQLQ